MHLREETFFTVFFSTTELGQIRSELAAMADEAEIDWTKYPSLDRLTDTLIHEGSTEI